MTNSSDFIEINESLIKQLISPFENAFNQAPYYPLNSLPSVDAHGIYCLYLAIPKGTPYQEAVDPLAPIYIGKSSPSHRERSSKSGLLNSRLRKHIRSIDQAENLSLENFLLRFMAISPQHSAFTPLIESHFIHKLKPLWNTHITGFGINAPGKGRAGQSPSTWDSLHPGREFAKHLTGKPQNVEDIISIIRSHAHCS